MKETLLRGDIDNIGNLLDISWQNKKKMSKEITNPVLDDIYDTALKAGANGGKISGAGGGGFIMFYCPANSKQKVIKELTRFGGRAYNYVFVDDGLITLTVK
jgi:D-glycero-alpha-D-manno-heptose-7-phosphate kinase